jgi:uncharacterized protein
MKLILYAAVIYLGLLALLYVLQRSLIYFPDKQKISPAEAGVPEMKLVQMETDDGLVIRAWYRPAEKNYLPTLVYFHGNAGNIANRGMIVRPFLEEGYGVLLTTYRGYSGNPGNPSEKGLYSDARAAMTFLEKENIPLKCSVVYGNSIGAAVAIQTAVDYNVGALILQSPFSSITDVAKIHYAFFQPFLVLIKDRFDSLSKAGRIRSPVLMIHGKSDNIIPPELGRKLFEALPEPKESHYVSNRGHNDLFEPDLAIDFINKHIRCSEERTEINVVKPEPIK